jgi:hypothetical protein
LVKTWEKLFPTAQLSAIGETSMALSAITAAVTLFYLSAIPIHIALRLHIGPVSFFGFGISAFEPRFALKQSLQARSISRRKPSIKKEAITDVLKSAFRSLKYASDHTKIERIRLDGSFGSGDAALTALVCGSTDAVGYALRGAAGKKVQISLAPDFSADSLRAELVGMISIRAGHIMFAALLGAIQYGSRRLKKWISTPLKAS